MEPMRRPATLAAVIAGGLIAVGAYFTFARPDEVIPASNPSDASTLQAAAFAKTIAASEPSAIDLLGAPDDPLPAPLPLPAIADPIERGQAAETLARQVLAAGPDSLPALIAALQASGIAILGAGDSVDAKPAEPWQEMTMQRWEVRTSTMMVLPERTVILSSADLTEVLVAAIPELKGAPLGELIVKNVRSLAESPVTTRRFFARFIAELGRNATSHTPYDLLGTVDPQTIQLDGLQAWLIVRRLAIGMQGINSYLESHGFPGARNLGTISSIVSTLLAYARWC